VGPLKFPPWAGVRALPAEGGLIGGGGGVPPVVGGEGGVTPADGGEEVAGGVGGGTPPPPQDVNISGKRKTTARSRNAQRTRKEGRKEGTPYELFSSFFHPSSLFHPLVGFSPNHNNF